MKKDPDFLDKKNYNRFEEKKKDKKKISQEIQDKNKIQKIFKQKKNQIKAEEIWQDWEENDEIH
jgi:hypothetical protein